MAKITKLYDTPPYQEQDGGMDDYKKKLFRHRAGRGAKYLIGAVVVLCGFLAYSICSQNKTYTSYETVSTVEHSSTVNTLYTEYNGKLLKYSKDGISCIDSQNEAIWSQTYNMQNPMVDICEGAVAVADQQGNIVYVFDAQGAVTEISTLLPIQQISVSAQGVTAILLNDSTVSWIYIYDKEGNKLAESRCSLDETGQPISIALSPDGTKLAVSYLQVQEGSAASCVVFYNFGSVGSNFVDKIVSSKVYTDTVIPRIRYIGKSICAAISDQEIIYYEGAEIPEEKNTVILDAEIESVFWGDSRVGIVSLGDDTTAENEEEAGRYRVNLYDTSGKQILSRKTDLEYSQVKLSGKYLILYNENECEIYNEKGILKYKGSFDSVIADLYKGNGHNKFGLVFSDRTETIRLQ